MTHESVAPERTGILEILNVQAGDIKITFDEDDVVETIRAKRIIADMLRRGYALVVEVERDGKKAFERVQGFDAEKGEYIIADFDPQTSFDSQTSSDNLARCVAETKQRVEAIEFTTRPLGPRPADTEEMAAETDRIVDAVARGIVEQKKPTKGPDPADTTKCTCGRPVNHRGMCKGVTRSRRLGMTTTRATAIGRSSGG